MDLAAWLQYLEQPRPIQPGPSRLTLVREIAKNLRLLPVPYRVLTVTGTNGKGSTVALCSHILTAAGYQVGTYSSPHLLRYNERIALNTKPVSDALLCEAFAAIEQARGQQELTYFEYSFLASLWVFSQTKIDVAVMEVGIGGRLDAVNVLDADVAVITTIDFDHMHYLGDSRESIGYEKAGIFRQHKPVVLGDIDIPQTVSSYAKQLQVSLYRTQQEFHYQQQANTWQWQCGEQVYQNLPLPQVYLANAAVSLMALACLDMPIARAAIDTGLMTAQLPGRQQVIQGPCQILLDVAHNPQAARLLAERFKQLPRSGKVRAIFSAFADKDLSGTIAPLVDLVDHWHYAPLTAGRAASLERLTEVLQNYSHSAHANMQEAFTAAIKQVQADDWLLVFGSFYTVAAIWEELKQCK